MNPLEATREAFRQLRNQLEGDLYTNELWQLMYATDASAFREKPIGVARPKNAADILRLIRFADATKIPLIPRAAGTSLAGQVVGNGLIVDISRHMTCILEVNETEKWVRVEPGVILDELNKFLEPKGLFFGPETSTSSRCMMSGMVGNNSCGAHSILYGSTRDHVISMKTILSDGSEAEFRELSAAEFEQKTKENSLEGRIYKNIDDILSDPVNQESIRKEFPDPAIHRRNTGYAVDLLLETDPFFHAEDRRQKTEVRGQRSEVRKQDNPASSIQHPASVSKPLFNFCKLLSGSEGTLAFTTEIKLNLVPLPPKAKALVCVHCRSISEALKANLIALNYHPGSVELMDKAIMECTRDNITQRQNRFFIEGDPEAILIVEFARETREEILGIAAKMEAEMREKGYGYHFPIVFPPELKLVWDLRKAGLGVLSNYPGDRKPVPVTEDTAVRPEDLTSYIEEFTALLHNLGLNCVYYAHAGSGELHLRPVLNLKDPADVELFHTVALETAKLVKKYHGSLSGEHGDGRLRGEFIPLMIGEHNYNLLKSIKNTWDPDQIFNPKKITDTPKMNTQLRFDPGKPVREIKTIFDFTGSHDILRATEQCNGSGDCRNTVLTGRWMCPSYMALKDENTTTRARANILREFITNSSKVNPFDHKEIYDVMDLCLSCKACKSECPSNVDIAKLKAEFLQHWYDANGIPLRSRLIAYITSINELGMLAPMIFNFVQKNRFLSGITKKLLGFAPKRNIPLLYKTTLKSWLHSYSVKHPADESKPKVYLFADEFSNFNDVEIGIKAVKLLHAFGYNVEIPEHEESGRTFLSKGLLRKAKKIANNNIRLLKDKITEATPLIGIEPSAILTFRDEYIDLAEPELREDAIRIAKNALMFDEFISSIQHPALRQAQGPASSPSTSSGPGIQDPALRQAQDPESSIRFKELFIKSKRTILLHGHCHQKALASVASTVKMLSIPENYKVEEIKSGCCGMAGSFGYEREHYDVSMKVGELVLFPKVREAAGDVIIAAPGTSCRHQIFDGTGRSAFHPIEILFEALVKS